MDVHYETEFRSDRPTVIFGSSLGTDGSMWKPQLEALGATWNTVTFDLRGHGKSPLSEVSPSIDTFADDVISVADALGVRTFAYCGLSIGGVIGQSLAARYAERVDALVLASTGLTILTPRALNERADRVLAEGMAGVAEASVSRWFNARFRAAQPEVVAAKTEHMRRMNARGYADACRALAGFDGAQIAADIKAPTLVIAGADDVATPPADGQKLASAIEGAVYQEIPDASHLCNVEQPELFVGLLREHIEEYARGVR